MLQTFAHPFIPSTEVLHSSLSMYFTFAYLNSSDFTLHLFLLHQPPQKRSTPIPTTLLFPLLHAITHTHLIHTLHKSKPLQNFSIICIFHLFPHNNFAPQLLIIPLSNLMLRIYSLDPLFPNHKFISLILHVSAPYITAGTTTLSYKSLFTLTSLHFRYYTSASTQQMSSNPRLLSLTSHFTNLHLQ